MASARSLDTHLTLAATRGEKGCWAGVGAASGVDSSGSVGLGTWNCRASPSSSLGCIVKDGITIMNGEEEESAGLLMGISE